jgi:hypothetical protein
MLEKRTEIKLLQENIKRHYFQVLLILSRNSRRSREFLSGLYPARGLADARNEGGDAPLSPPCDPPSGKDFLRKLSLIKAGLFLLFNQLKFTGNCCLRACSKSSCTLLFPLPVLVEFLSPLTPTLSPEYGGEGGIGSFAPKIDELWPDWEALNRL